MNSSKYWLDRIESLYDSSTRRCNADIARLYKNTMNELKLLIHELYDEITDSNGDVLNYKFYQYNKYMQMQNDINKKLRKLGEREIDIITDDLIKTYDKTYLYAGHVVDDVFKPSFTITQKTAEQIVSTAWCQGKHFSSRIWTNKSAMTTTLTNQIQSMIMTGMSKDKAISEMMKVCNVGFRQAECIVRTETNFVQGQSCANRYKQAGIEEYKFLATKDGRVCEKCEELDGKIFKFSEMEIGVNYSPIHPNCRDTIIPVIK